MVDKLETGSWSKDMEQYVKHSQAWWLAEREIDSLQQTLIGLSELFGSNGVNITISLDHDLDEKEFKDALFYTNIEKTNINKLEQKTWKVSASDIRIASEIIVIGLLAKNNDSTYKAMKSIRSYKIGGMIGQRVDEVDDIFKEGTFF